MKHWTRTLGEWWIPVFALLTLAAGLAFLAGCSDLGVAPDSQAPDVDRLLQAVEFAETHLPPDLDGVVASSGLEDDPYFCCKAEAKEKFDRYGGTLKLQLDNEEIFFEIPRWALYWEVEIEIKGWKFETPVGTVFLYECSPSGIHFNKPLVLDHPVDSTDGNLSAMFYKADDPSSSWELEEISRTADGRACFNIYHFSRYGISE